MAAPAICYDILMAPAEPTPATARIVLAVATRDRARTLEQTLLPSLRRVVAAGHRVVVVDQSVDDATRALLDGTGVELLRSAPGLSRARNVAVAATHEPLIAFTDDDVALPDGWLERLVAVFDAHPEAGAVCGRAMTPDGRLLPGSPAGERRWPTTPFQLGSGFNMAFRRAALADAGPFDVDLGAGARYRAAEDTDVLYRVLRRGWTVVCSDDVTVVHDDGRDRAAQRRVHVAYGLGAGAQTAKHLRAGDRAAGRIGLAAAAAQAYWALRHVLRGRPRDAVLPLCSLAGLLAGFARRLVARAHAGGAAGPSSPSRSSSRA
jgi:GT2 family glycosyltransferase